VCAESRTARPIRSRRAGSRRARRTESSSASSRRPRNVSAADTRKASPVRDPKPDPIGLQLHVRGPNLLDRNVESYGATEDDRQRIRSERAVHEGNPLLQNPGLLAGDLAERPPELVRVLELERRDDGDA
jgi:hypothetical protein